MELPFTQDAFFALFGRYNAVAAPVALLFYLMAALSVALLFRASRWGTLLISGTLAAMWAVNGVGYHWMFFREINPVAPLFAIVFVAQAVLLIVLPLRNPDFRFAAEADARSAVGLVLIVFATVIYPLWGWIAGHVWPDAPLFGIAPCPTTIFTIGILLTGTWRVARWLLVVSGIWAAIGGSAAILLGVPQDFALLAALALLVMFALGRLSRLQFARHTSSDAS